MVVSPCTSYLGILLPLGIISAIDVQLLCRPVFIARVSINAELAVPWVGMLTFVSSTGGVIDWRAGSWRAMAPRHILAREGSHESRHCT
jgi:hypothetical protein